MTKKNSSGAPPRTPAKDKSELPAKDLDKVSGGYVVGGPLDPRVRIGRGGGG